MRLARTRLFTSPDRLLFRSRMLQIPRWIFNSLKLFAEVCLNRLSWLVLPQINWTLFSIWPVATFFPWINKPPICILANYWCMFWDWRTRLRLTCHWCDWLALKSAVTYSLSVTSIINSSVQVPVLDVWGKLGCCSFMTGQNYRWIITADFVMWSFVLPSLVSNFTHPKVIQYVCNICNVCVCLYVCVSKWYAVDMLTLNWCNVIQNHKILSCANKWQ